MATSTAPSPDDDRPYLSRNLAELVVAAAHTDPGHPALRDLAADRTVTWGELDAAVRADTDRLRAAGVGPGDRVVVRLPTSAPYCVAVFSVLRAGGVLVPVGVAATARELTAVLAHCGAGLLVAAGDDPVADEAAGSVPRVGPPALDAPAPPAEPAPSGGAEPVGGGEDVAVLSYTSGTSGGPRGVMLSHRALLANLAQCSALRPAPVTGADRVLLALPLFHSYGLGPGLLQVAYSAATAVLVDRFDPQESLDVVHRHRVTAVVGVPPMYRAWLRLPAAEVTRSLGTVRMFTSGAAPLEPWVLTGMRERTGLDVFEGYGLTETGPVLSSTLAGGGAKPGSVGRALPGSPTLGVEEVQLRLVDADGAPLPMDGDEYFDEDAGGTGVVAARGPNLFSGYWPDGAQRPGPLPRLGDGWIRTGDVGFVDADGDLHLIDRAGDLIIVNGFNVYPHEVEEVLREHPAVAEAAAVGIADDRTGEAVRAVLVAVPGAGIDAAEIIEHCAVRLARFKVPVEVAVVEELPHSPTGKLARRKLRVHGKGEVFPGAGGAPLPAARGAEDTAADLF